MGWDFETNAELERQLDWVRGFVRDEIYPLETLELNWHSYRRMIEPLIAEVKARGLWAAHLGPEHGGQGLGQVPLALLHEALGGSELCPPVFGNQAPDAGNAELLAIAGTPEQKARWLQPLLDGSVYSAFAMTEQGTGSDPRQLTTAAVRDGGDWVINGRKWMVANAGPSDFPLVMARTEPSANAAPRRTMSMLVVPRETPGIGVRDVGVMHDPGNIGPVHVYGEIHYDNVRVPANSLLGGEGQAFALAQARLGPGRIQHCMRWIGVCRRAFDAMCERAVSMSVHGSLLSDKQTIQNWIADSAAAIESVRLLTLMTAWKIDRNGAKAARKEIAMIKYHGVSVMHDVIDRAIQVHGSLGYSTDMPLEQMYRWARASRFYDGPDEVHRVTAARQILRDYRPCEVPTEHVPTRRAQALDRLGDRLDEFGVR